MTTYQVHIKTTPQSRSVRNSMTGGRTIQPVQTDADREGIEKIFNDTVLSVATIVKRHGGEVVQQFPMNLSFSIRVPNKATDAAIGEVEAIETVDRVHADRKHYARRAISRSP